MTGNETKPARSNMAGAVIFGVGLALAGVLLAIGTYSINFTNRDTYLSCYDVQGEPEGVSTALNSLTSAEMIPFPFGVSCSWQMADGSVLHQPTFFVTESAFFLAGIALVVFGLFVVARQFLGRGGTPRQWGRRPKEDA